MKKLLLLLSLFIAAQSYAQNVPSYVPTNGLVGWWPFSGNAIDSSGNGNNGTVNGATPNTDRFGNLNKSYSFNGSSNYILMPTMINMPMGSNPRTLSVWMKPSSLSNLWTLTAIGYGSSSTNNAFMFGLGNNIITVQGWANDFNSPLNYTINQWIHAVCTYDGTNIKIYVNGVFIGSGINSMWNTIGTEFYFGARPSLGNSYFPGQLDDIGIWNRALSACEIKKLYNAGNSSSNIIVSGSTTICQGSSLSLTTAQNAGNTYQWMFNNTIITGANTNTFSAQQAGAYKVIVSNNGCIDTSLATIVNVNPLPNVTISSDATNLNCANDSIVLNAQTSASNATFQWQRNGINISGATLPSYKAYQTGTYTALVIVNACTGSSQVALTNNPMPTPVILYNNGVLTVSGGPYTSYQWYISGAPIQGATNASYTPSINGAYSVVVTLGNCSFSSQTYIMSTVGINSIKQNPVVVYPNPTNNKVQIETNQAIGYCKVYNAMGQFVLESHEKHFDLNEKPNGVYFLLIYNQTNELISCSKIFKQ